MGLSKRNTRQLILGGAVAIVVIYLPLSLFYLFLASTRQIQTSGADDSQTGPREPSIGVRISDVNGDANGNVNVVLTLNVNDLLRFLDGDLLKKGEATGNPPPDSVRLLINSPDVCRKSAELKYIVYVHTSPEHRHRRDLLRATWLSRTLFSEAVLERIFLMGRADSADMQEKIRAESETHGDIVQGDFSDNYKNLTLKALMGLQWVISYCPQAEFAIKADDDAFVNIFGLRRFLDAHRDKKRLLACPLWGENAMPILRDPSKCAKWCVKFTEFPGKRYFPKYCAGLTFILSRDLVPLLYNASRITPFFWIDDVYVTGLLPTKVHDVQYVSLIKNFTLKPDEAMAELKDGSRELRHLFVHAKKIEDFLPMWKLLLKRLAFDDVRLLSTDVIESNADLKKVLMKGSKTES